MGIQKTKAKNKQTNNNSKEFKNSTRDPARFPITSFHSVRPRILLNSLFYRNKKSATRIRLTEMRFRKCQDSCGRDLSINDA